MAGGGGFKPYRKYRFDVRYNFSLTDTCRSVISVWQPVSHASHTP